MNRSLVARLLSPTGFVLVLLLFLLPFLAVACDVDTPDEKLSLSATFTGWDLVVGGHPDVRSSIQDQRLDEVGDPIDAQPLAIMAVAVLAAGIVLSALRAPVTRFAAGAGAGLVAAALIFAAEFAARSDLLNLLRPNVADLDAGLTAEDLVRTRYGFWVALLVALAVALGNAVALTRALRSGPASPDPAAEDGPDEGDGGLSMFDSPPE